MRTPAEVARQIKAALKLHGIPAEAQSLNYQVKVTADGTERARTIAKDVYHQEMHSWLVVWVDNYALPMPPLRTRPLIRSAGGRDGKQEGHDGIL